MLFADCEAHAHFSGGVQGLNHMLRLSCRTAVSPHGHVTISSFFRLNFRPTLPQFPTFAWAIHGTNNPIPICVPLTDTPLLAHPIHRPLS